ncbi:MAG: hypothetical protein J3R72DRAFT_430680, partial [Linnemannia gamsii]
MFPCALLLFVTNASCSSCSVDLMRGSWDCNLCMDTGPAAALMVGLAILCGLGEALARVLREVEEDEGVMRLDDAEGDPNGSGVMRIGMVYVSWLVGLRVLY